MSNLPVDQNAQFDSKQCLDDFETYLRGEGSWSNKSPIPSSALTAGIIGLGGIVWVGFVAVYIGMAFVLQEFSFIWPSFLLLIFGCVVTIVAWSKFRIIGKFHDLEQKQGFRGYSRNTLARILYVLDNLCHGIPDVTLPDGFEFRRHYAHVGHDSIRIVSHHLMRMIQDLAKPWHETMKELLRKSDRKIDRIMNAVFGLFVAASLIIYIMLHFAIIFGWRIENIIQVGISIVVFLLILLPMYIVVYVSGVHTFHNRIRKQINASVRDTTCQMIQTLIDEIRRELVCPFNVYLIGKYRNTYRTGRKIVTSEELTLYETFILPDVVVVPQEWIDFD